MQTPLFTYRGNAAGLLQALQAHTPTPCNHPSYRLYINSRTKKCLSCGHITNEGDNL